MAKFDGYTEIANDLFRRDELATMSKVDRLVYIAMLCLTHNSKGYVDASQNVIASCAGIETKTLRVSLSRLLRTGAIKYVSTPLGTVATYAVADLERAEGVGFYKLPNGWLWETPLPTNAKIVYLVLRAWRNSKTGISTPAHGTITREARISNNSVSLAIYQLGRYGLVEKLSTHRVGPRQPLNRYRVSEPAEVSVAQLPNFV